MLTKKEIIKLVERNMKNNPNPMIDGETARKPLDRSQKRADKKSTPCLSTL